MNLTNTLLIVYCITIVDTYVEPQRNLYMYLDALYTISGLLL